MSRDPSPPRLAFFDHLADRRLSRWQVAQTRRPIESIDVNQRGRLLRSNDRTRGTLKCADVSDRQERGYRGHDEKSFLHGRGGGQGSYRLAGVDTPHRMSATLRGYWPYPSVPGSLDP